MKTRQNILSLIIAYSRMDWQTNRYLNGRNLHTRRSFITSQIMPYKTKPFLNTKITINQDWNCKIIKNTEIEVNVLALWQPIYWTVNWTIGLCLHLYTIHRFKVGTVGMKVSEMKSPFPHVALLPWWMWIKHLEICKKGNACVGTWLCYSKRLPCLTSFLMWT